MSLTQTHKNMATKIRQRTRGW